MRPIYGLNVILRVIIVIKHDYRVGSLQIDPKATRSGGQQENFGAKPGIELLDDSKAFWAGDLRVNSAEFYVGKLSLKQ